MITLATIKGKPTLMVAAVSELALHHGRIFLGTSKNERTELGYHSAIKALSRAYVEQTEEKLYLTRAPKPQEGSRQDRWRDATNRASSALEELLNLQGEFLEWKDSLSENTQSGATWDKLEAVTDLDLESARDTLEEAANLELPQGFGRD